MSGHDPWSAEAAAARFWGERARLDAALIPPAWHVLAPADQDVVRERAYTLQRTAVPAAVAWQTAMEEHARRVELRAAIAAALRAALRRPASRILRRGVRR
jgi:hypothetical protein